MAAFRAGEIDVLVSTTVIEVGIDVPNATVMVIEDASRFGLSQLHQLRGRVGRGQHPGSCLLIADPTTPEGEARLDAMIETTDGFRLAEEDLRIRGQGTVFGTRQSGVKDLRLANILEDFDTLVVPPEVTLLGWSTPTRNFRNTASWRWKCAPCLVTQSNGCSSVDRERFLAPFLPLERSEFGGGVPKGRRGLFGGVVPKGRRRSSRRNVPPSRLRRSPPDGRCAPWGEKQAMRIIAGKAGGRRLKAHQTR